jgi:hypothetical protein
LRQNTVPQVEIDAGFDERFFDGIDDDFDDAIFQDLAE